MNQQFSETREIADRIEGMMSHFSMAVIDSLLAFQASSGIVGDMVEMGVYRGKSAAVLARRLSHRETLRLYDIDEVERARLPAGAEFTRVSTAKLRKRHFGKRSVRFCHVDSSHMFAATVHELELADHMLGENGIIALDDFTNLDFSQMMAGMFKYLFTKRTDLKLCLVTAEKAYLCRRAALPLYETFFIGQLERLLVERGIPETCLARTEIAEAHRPFHLRTRLPDEPARYGASTYGHLFDPDPLPNLWTRTLHFLARNIRRTKYGTEPWTLR